MKKPSKFANIPDEFVRDIIAVKTEQGSVGGCMRWVRNEPGFSIWVSEAPSCCCRVYDGLTMAELHIPAGNELRLREGQGLTAC
jgi:hypothetical protein